MTTPDPFALGRLPDRGAVPSVADLWAEYRRLDREIDVLDESASAPEAKIEFDRLIARQVEIENRITETIATDAAGLVAQAELLRQYSRDFEWSEWSENLVGKLIAGIAILGEPTPRAEDAAA